MFAITDTTLSNHDWHGSPFSDNRRHYRGRNHLYTSTAGWTAAPALPSDQPYWDDMFANSIRIGINAAKMTFKPALWIWATMISIALFYYLVPASHAVFDALVTVQEKTGVFFASIGMGLSVGILVECLRVMISREKRWTRQNTGNAVFNFIIWSIMGTTQHYRYAWQVEVFGAGNSFSELITKVSFDQFIWTVFFANPYQSILYLWKNNRYSWKAVFRQASPFRTFWGTKMLPMLISNWAFWIPMAFLVYFFPPELQIPMAILAVTIWVTLLSFLTESTPRDES